MTAAEASIVATYCGARMVPADIGTENGRFYFDTYDDRRRVSIAVSYVTPYGISAWSPATLIRFILEGHP
jgi:hypothetical protein